MNHESAYELFAGPDIHQLFDSLTAAIEFARSAGCEAFEVLDADGWQVYVEYPRPQWV